MSAALTLQLTAQVVAPLPLGSTYLSLHYPWWAPLPFNWAEAYPSVEVSFVGYDASISNNVFLINDLGVNYDPGLGLLSGHAGLGFGPGLDGDPHGGNDWDSLAGDGDLWLEITGVTGTGAFTNRQANLILHRSTRNIFQLLSSLQITNLAATNWITEQAVVG